MILTAALVREACTLLRWRAPRLAKNAGIGFDKARQAMDDDGIASLNWLDLQAIREAFERSGIEFGTNGAVRLRRTP